MASHYSQSIPAAAAASALSVAPADAGLQDPSTADGSIVVFQRDMPLEVRHSDDHDSNLGTLLSVTVKILVLYEEDGLTPQQVRIELSRETDLFFSMYHSLQPAGFTAIQARQKLLCSFPEYPHMLLTNFLKCCSQPHECMSVLYIHRDGAGRMDLIQNISGFKFVELLSIDFLLTPSELIKQHIIYRYFAVKQQCATLTERLREVQDLVKQKSPSLMLAIKKQSASSAAAAGRSANSAAPSPSSSPAPQQQQHSRHSSSTNTAPHHSSNGSFGGTGGSFATTKRAVR